MKPRPLRAKVAAEKVEKADSSRAEGPLGITKRKDLYGTAEAVPFQNIA
jgi:hypothetical protein